MSFGEDVVVTEEAFHSFCAALPYCPSLTTLVLDGLLIRSNRVEQLTDTFSNAVVNSSLIKLIVMGDPSTLAATVVFQTLIRTDAVKNYDVDFSRHGELFCFDRTQWWKRVLREDIPLRTWKIILEEANKLSTRDILYYLVKEKNVFLMPRR